MAEPLPEIKSTNSLVAKHLTPELWEKLSGEMTETSGFTLSKAIACAVEFDNQHMGIYAGDSDTYSVFADVFNPIILEYHGLEEGFSHISDLDIEKVDGTINTDAPVLSTRIRVGRNIEGYGMSPGITQEQRVAVEGLMINTFPTLKDDLEGEYYPLSGMDETVRQQLVDDHFLFVSGDPNLIAAGMERDWPEGRGIFHNNGKTFLVWVNEEDQLRIISMEKGGDIKGVFARLVNGINTVEESIRENSEKSFLLDDRLGYLHSCPSNLGTGMRASVHIDLPGWTAEGVSKLRKRCEQLSLQPRGTRGESGGETGCTYDISNKHRLGYSEVQLVQTMIDGVNQLYQEDIELKETHFPFPDIMSSGSLVEKHVTEEVWYRYAGLKTDTTGFTLDKAIFCAAFLDNQHVGIYAGDEDSYEKFSGVFDPIILDYHGLEEDFEHKTDMDITKIVGNVNPSAPVHSTRIRVGRNIEGYGLSPGITQEQRIEVEATMKNIFGTLEGDYMGEYFALEGMEEENRKKLVDDHFLFMSGDPNLAAAGMERDWPEGRGIFHNTTKTFLVWVNEEDQLRLISMEKGGDVRGVFSRLIEGIEKIQSCVNEQTGKSFMLHPKLGYLHSCPTNLGTGMRASVHIDLPGWTAEGMDSLKARCEELSLQPRGTRGESGGQTGCTYDISNKHRLGYTEVELIQTMIDGVNMLYEEDLELKRKHFPFPSIKSTNSLVSKHLIEDVWLKYSGVTTKTSGFSLEQAIACSIEGDDQHVGIYAGDRDSYKTFENLFNPIILEYHDLSSIIYFEHKPDLDVEKIDGMVDPEAPVICTRVRIGRNLDGYGLSPAITKEHRVEVESVLKGSVMSLEDDLKGDYFALLDMSEEVRNDLNENKFIFSEGDLNLSVAGMERDWPEGRGVFHNESKTLLAWINEEDHLRIIAMESGSDINGVFGRLVKAVKGIECFVEENGKSFMLDDRLGYIHSCPTNLGTGMRASFYICLPGWAKHGFNELQNRCAELSLQCRELTNEEYGSDLENVFDISNRNRLGFSEVEIIQNIIEGINNIYKEDLELQTKYETNDE